LVLIIKIGEEKMSDQENLKKLNIKALVVEDYLMNQELLESMLDSLGCNVDVANDGKQALEKFKNNDYDVVFMDLRMPVMDGYQTTKNMIKLSGDKNIPIIAVTANASDSDRKICEKIGISHYIAKPIKTDDISNVLKKYFN